MICSKVNFVSLVPLASFSLKVNSHKGKAKLTEVWKTFANTVVITPHAGPVIDLPDAESLPHSTSGAPFGPTD